MLLVLLRHGIAIERCDPDCPADPDRALTGRGRRRTRLSARGLRRIGVRPDRIVSSPWRRALETAQIAAARLGPRDQPLTTPRLLPGSDPVEFLTWVHGLEAESIVAVGHAPHLDAVLNVAVGGASRLPALLKKAGAAGIVFDPSLGPAAGRLVWLLEPRMLRHLGRR
jgi:phosphohistidine phosphatase